MKNKNVFYYILKSISKYYSIPIAIIGFGLTTLSSLGVSLDYKFSFSVFLATSLIMTFVIILLIISLNICVREVDYLSRVSYDFGALPKVISITHDAQSDYTKILLDAKGDSYLEKDYLASIMFKSGDSSVCEIAVGVINNIQPDGKVVVFVEPISKYADSWKSITDKPEDFYDRLFAKTLIHKDYYKRSLYEDLREIPERKLQEKYDRVKSVADGEIKL
ncbi:hypothetical protein MN202_16925 [Rheinheimera muenzenbergensis]|uniref:Uncharacterized protein n=1 Tax=Rheinheimera muenzenbergensis TaxID=1193628 RepID=A0ABU8CAQ2_9GAMM